MRLDKGLEWKRHKEETEEQHYQVHLKCAICFLIYDKYTIAVWGVNSVVTKWGVYRDSVPSIRVTFYKAKAGGGVLEESISLCHFLISVWKVNHLLVCVLVFTVKQQQAVRKVRENLWNFECTLSPSGLCSAYICSPSVSKWELNCAVRNTTLWSRSWKTLGQCSIWTPGFLMESHGPRKNWVVLADVWPFQAFNFSYQKLPNKTIVFFSSHYTLVPAR